MRKITVGGMVRGTDQKTKQLEVEDEAAVTAIEALRQYFELPSTEDVYAKIDDHVVRVDNQTIDREDLASTTVDKFISVYPAQVAQGGVRGASQVTVSVRKIENGFIMTVHEEEDQVIYRPAKEYIFSTVPETLEAVGTFLVPLPVA